MIVNVRGTSGSGKSTLINNLMSLCTDKTPVFAPTGVKRKQPLGYTMRITNSPSVPDNVNLFIPGHYESACGGCDTLGKWLPGVVEPRIINGEEPNSYHLTFGLIRQYHQNGYNVVYEGLLLSGDVRHTKALHDDDLPVHVVAFDLPVELCIKSVLDRRQAAGNTKPFNEHNTREKHALMGRCLDKLEAAGVPVHKGDREMCWARVVDLLTNWY